eukprot:Nk52_evm23s150 gene=Nk52_evmTU23s150
MAPIPGWVLLLFGALVLQGQVGFASASLSLISPEPIGEDVGVVGIGDFNNDRMSDVFVWTYTADGQAAIQLYLYSEDSGSFEVYKTLGKSTGSITLSSLLSGSSTDGYKIGGLVPADYDVDGWLDLMVSVCQLKGELNACKNVFLLQKEGDLELQSGMEFSSDIPPTLLDANGNMVPDFFSVEGGSRTFRIGTKDSFSSTEFFPGQSFKKITAEQASSVGFVDMNGDCLADLVVASTTDDGNTAVEIWLNNARGTETQNSASNPYFQLEKTYNMTDKVTTSLVFGDVDQNGSTDIIYGSQDNKIMLLSNVQKGTCSIGFDFTASDCRNADELCVGDSNFKLADAVPIGDPMDTETSFVSYNSAKADNLFPMKVILVDIDRDGDMDALAIMRSGDTTSVYKYETSVTDGNVKMTASILPSTSFEGTVVNGLSAMSLGYNHWLDVIVIGIGADGRQLKTAFYQPDDGKTTYTVKYLAGNGVCSMWCSSGPTFPRPKPYGVNQAGVVAKHVFTSSSGSTVTAMYTQMAQTGGLCMSLGYVVGTIGTFASYIDYAFIAIPFKSDQEITFIRIPSVLPNSQLYITPNPLDSSDVDQWNIDTYIYHWGTFNVIAGIWAGACGLIALLVLFFHWREKKEDKLEKMRMAHLFHFDAL